jgi:hypothetical protein
VEDAVCNAPNLAITELRDMSAIQLRRKWRCMQRRVITVRIGTQLHKMLVTISQPTHDMIGFHLNCILSTSEKKKNGNT